MKKPAYLLHLLKTLGYSFKPKQLSKIRKVTRGRPSVYSSHAMLAVFLVMMVKGIGSFKRVHKFLKEHPRIRYGCGLQRLPHRSTLSRRLRAFFSGVLKGRTYIWEPEL